MKGNDTLFDTYFAILPGLLSLVAGVMTLSKKQNWNHFTYRLWGFNLILMSSYYFRLIGQSYL